MYQLWIITLHIRTFIPNLVHVNCSQVNKKQTISIHTVIKKLVLTFITFMYKLKFNSL